MKRHTTSVRPDWMERVESLGLTYHSHADGLYWDESVCYELTDPEVNALERAANDLHRLCIEAAEKIMERDWWGRLGIPIAAIPSIRASWDRDDFSLYGRFDLAFDGHQPPKMLEYNSDTPTALLEASVVQWFWLQETHPESDQFNSIHERLIAAWNRRGGERLHFCSVSQHPEDEQTVLYLRDTCEQAGVKTKFLHVENIGWDDRLGCFVDVDGEPIRDGFKLYPWEWMWSEEFGKHLASATTKFIEPAWKMLISGKGILPVLWELFPEHPNLLPAFESPEPFSGSFVRKPLWSREGANVQLVKEGAVVEETFGDHSSEPVIFQALAPIPNFDGHHPVFGAWVVDHEAAGLGIREDLNRITGNLSRFVPHFFNPSKP